MLVCSRPLERWTEKAARKRPQSVCCVVGETTYMPMGMLYLCKLRLYHLAHISVNRYCFWF